MDWDRGPTATDFFNGQINEVRLWDHVRSLSEIQSKVVTQKVPEVAPPETSPEEIPKADDTDPEYWIQKGELTWASSSGKINEALTALEYFDKAIELDPLNYLAWANKGLVLKTLKRVDDALLCYNRALTINPKYITVWYNKGVLLGSIGNFKEAINAFDKVLELNPNHEFAKRDREILLSIVSKQKKEIAQPQAGNPEMQ